MSYQDAGSISIPQRCILLVLPGGCCSVPAQQCMSDTAPRPGAKLWISEKEPYVLSLSKNLFSNKIPPSHKEKFRAHLSQVQRLNSAEFMTFPCVLWPTVNTEEFLLHCLEGCFLSEMWFACAFLIYKELLIRLFPHRLLF